MNLLSARCPNQLVQNGNFVDTSGWGTDGYMTLSVSNNIATLTPTANYGECNRTVSFVDGHKYYIAYQINRHTVGNANNLLLVITSGNTIRYRLQPTAITGWQNLSAIFTASNSMNKVKFQCLSYLEGFSAEVKNIIAIDLTELYGAGNEPTTVAQFKQDYPLDYYPYSATSYTGLLQQNGKAVSCDLGIKGRLILNFDGLCDLLVEKCPSSNINVGQDSIGKYIRVISASMPTTNLIALNNNKTYLVFSKLTRESGSYKYTTNFRFAYTNGTMQYIQKGKGTYGYNMTLSADGTTTVLYPSSLQVCWFTGNDVIRDFQLYEID